MLAVYGPPPTHLVRLPDGRDLAVDDVGDPDGVPVLFVHGTPDTRRARHPDDELATAAGVRLLALDRPGFGASSPHADATFASFAGDVELLLADLSVERAAILTWSAGAPWALAAAVQLGPRLTGMGLVAGTVPVEAYADAAIRDAAGDPRLAMVEAAAELGAAEAAEMMAPMLVPDPPTWELGHEHLTGHDDTTRAELASVPGAPDRMVEALLDSIAGGFDGLIADLRCAYSPSGIALDAVTAPVALWYGGHDDTCPTAFGRWYEAHLPQGQLREFPTAGHALLLTHWEDMLRTLRAFTQEN